MCIVSVFLEQGLTSSLMRVKGLLVTRCSHTLERAPWRPKTPKFRFWFKNWHINMCIDLGYMYKANIYGYYKILVFGHKRPFLVWSQTSGSQTSRSQKDGHKRPGHKKMVTNVRVTNVRVTNVMVTNVLVTRIRQPYLYIYIYIYIHD